MKRLLTLALVILATGSLSTAEAQRQRETPYWASISGVPAMMRTGPGRNYPATWQYVRRDLPVRVVEVYQSWRKVQDPDGATGWFLVNLLSDARNAIVRGEQPAPMHEQPNEAAPVRYRAEPGVVGRISRCADGWCHFDVSGRAGYIRVARIWGVQPEETVD